MSPQKKPTTAGEFLPFFLTPSRPPPFVPSHYVTPTLEMQNAARLSSPPPLSAPLRNSDPGDAQPSARYLTLRPPSNPLASSQTNIYPTGRTTRSGAEFSPFTFDNAVPYQTAHVSLRELLVRRSQDAPTSDTESLVGSEFDSEQEAAEDLCSAPSPPPPESSDGEDEEAPALPTDVTYTRWVYPLAPPKPKPERISIIRCARPGAPPDPQPSTYSYWRQPPTPPCPAPYQERFIRIPRLPPPVTTSEIRSKPAGLKAIAARRVRQSEPVVLELDWTDYPLLIASSGWMGLRQDEPDTQAYNLDELLAEDPEFELYDWNGIPQPVIDREQRVLLVLGGCPPNASDWQPDVAARAAAEMENAAQEIFTGRRKPVVAPINPLHRGPHAAEHVGPAMGGGQRYPMNLAHSVVNLARLFGAKCFQQISGWTNVLFMGFAPLLHQYYASTLDSLCEWDAAEKRAKHLWRNFTRAFSVFSTVTFNFGPATVTFPHIDFGNLAWGWCAITALGDFDPDRGGAPDSLGLKTHHLLPPWRYHPHSIRYSSPLEHEDPAWGAPVLLHPIHARRHLSLGV
ncbi:hypothetical protein FB451DRAFT_1187544 [Mycena latifolia]|nr:hypothetical protein FB451DRAFT_1187544 [Mycena latifolia]